MSTGLLTALQNQFVTVPETNFMVIDPAGVPLYHSDVGSDGNGLSNPQNWVEHVADGQDLVQATVMVGEEGLISRTFMPRYALMERLLRGTCGLPVSSTLIDSNTRRKLVFSDFGNGSPDVETYTGYYGTFLSAARLMGGRVRSWNIDARRSSDGGSVSGNIEYQFNRIIRNCVIPGGVARNSVHRFFSSKAIGNGVFAVSAYTNVATPTAEIQTLNTQAGYLGGAISMSILGNPTPQTFVPGDTLASIRAKIETLIGAAANSVTLSGTSTAAAAAGYSVSGITGASYLIYNANYATDGSNTSDGVPRYKINQSGTDYWLVKISGVWYITTAVTSITSTSMATSGPPLAQVTSASSTPPTSGWTINTGPYAGSGGVVSTASIAGGAGSASLTMTLPAGVNYAQITSSTTGVVTATTQNGAAASNFVTANITILPTDTAAQIIAKFAAHPVPLTVTVTGAQTLVDGWLVEVVSPANTRVNIRRVSGINWAVQQVSLGSAGTELVYFEKSPYLEPDHYRVYIATDEADMASINFYDLPDDEGQGGDPHLLQGATAATFAAADLSKLHYSGNTKRHATDFVRGGRNFTASVILPNDETPGSDTDFFWRLQDGCISGGFWLIRVFSCGSYEYVERMYVGRNQQVGFEVDNDVALRNFGLRRRRNPENTASLRFDLTLPVTP